MEIQMNINTNKVIIKVKPHELSNIKAFAELQFVNSSGAIIFKVKGITIKEKQFGNSSKSIITADFPAFPSKKGKNGFMTSFVIENKDIWREITNAVLDEYSRQTGTNVTPIQKQEEISPDDIPF